MGASGGIALLTGGRKRDGHQWLVAGYADERNAQRTTLIETGAEIGMYAGIEANDGDVGLRARIRRQGVDRGVPDVVRREDWTGLRHPTADRLRAAQRAVL